VIGDPASLPDRLARYRASLRSRSDTTDRPAAAPDAMALAERLATTLDAEIVHGRDGIIVRRERPSAPLFVDRARLATLPGQPPTAVPLICLDTETTGLATAAGTVAFLIGLGWWEAERFRQVQLVLPDQGEESALLTALRAAIPADAWLVTYNGRGFDWPLMVARYRLAGQAAPVHAGHLDLLPVVRRLFRHRMPDARLQTAERELLGLRRHHDVGGWEIPSRYLDFLRDGSADALIDVIDHNDLDVRSLAQLLAYLVDRLADPGRRASAAPGDLAGLARAYARERRLAEALACLEAADGRPIDAAPHPIRTSASPGIGSEDVAWWSVDRDVDFGGPPRDRRLASRRGEPWTAERIAGDRARVLRRLGRHPEAADVWTSLAAGNGRTAIEASIELAKLREHRLADRSGALRAAVSGLAAAERRRRSGRPERALEADLRHRIGRLRRRLASESVETSHPTPDRRSIGYGLQTDPLYDQ
jgi:uncharacterized protein YprB with RNaseH-like and TPR domain